MAFALIATAFVATMTGLFGFLGFFIALAVIGIGLWLAA